jgi:hypothetical protein
VPTWLTAIFTGVLAVGAIVTSVFAILAFRKQSAEVRLLQKQAQQQQQESLLQAEERRWRQATLVYAARELLPEDRPGAGGVSVNRRPRDPVIAAEVHNTSGQPVYDVRVHWVDWGKGSQTGAEDQLGTIGPGLYKGAQRTVPAGTAEHQFIPVAYFRDAAGLRWTVLADGHLAPVDASLQAGAPLIATTAVAAAAQPPGRMPAG